MIEVALFGAAGYTGIELAKLLTRHQRVRLVCAASDGHAGQSLANHTGRRDDLVFVTTSDALASARRCGAVLLAVPPEPARHLVEQLTAAGSQAPRIIDLSHAHRGAPDATYGLTSWFATDIARAALIANPGCYATAVITACAPVARRGWASDFIVCAGSGVTGAGRSSDESLSLGELYGNVRAYKVLRHQHVPEIEAALARLADHRATRPRVVLTTHLLPIARGIFATVTVQLARPSSTGELVAALRADYESDPTVAIADTPEDVSLRAVVGTNLCLIGGAVDNDRAVITVAIDNLLKGAAGQAIENMNLVLGFPRTMGLEHLARHA